MTMKTITATELAGATGDALMEAMRGPVAISRHGRPRFVLMTVEHYRALLENQGSRRALSIGSDEDLEEIARVMGTGDGDDRGT
jgi:prevent-host-death family protein